MKAVKGRALLDVKSGYYLVNPYILIDGSRIVDIKFNQPSNCSSLIKTDLILLPGLTDAHCHLTYGFDSRGRFGFTNPTEEELYQTGLDNMTKILSAGFTTVRDLGSPVNLILRFEDEMKELLILSSGEPIFSEQDLSEQIRRCCRQPVAWIKVFNGLNEKGQPLFNDEQIGEIVTEAEKYGKYVAVHAHEPEAIKASVAGGARSIEHGTFIDDEAIEMMLDHGTYLCPTLMLPYHYLANRERFNFPESNWNFFRKMKHYGIKSAQRAHQAGIPIVLSTDAVAGIPGHNAKEFIYLKKAGLSPLEAIAASTTTAAELLNYPIGVISSGRDADIIGVYSDPLNELSTLQNVPFVMANGKIIKNDL